MKNYRWAGGLVVLVILAGAILFCPVPLMLGWQSNFLARAFLCLLVSAALCFFRIFKGPTAPDRAVAVDMLGILIVGFCALLSIPTGRDWYIDIGIAWALQSFIGIMALSKYLEGKDFDE
ncbi:MAG: cation:proton antiporter [Candidatus Omnitrophica bacterium]|nr:cation:proton antiporter [Candidatus Omnitrophota bacterium]MDD5436437.1 cation:proton antiporter [Candidatus Omnitrophota bacterium]